jgi:hypothetical protein
MTRLLAALAIVLALSSEALAARIYVMYGQGGIVTSPGMLDLAGRLRKLGHTVTTHNWDDYNRIAADIRRLPATTPIVLIDFLSELDQQRALRWPSSAGSRWPSPTTRPYGTGSRPPERTLSASCSIATAAQTSGGTPASPASKSRLRKSIRSTWQFSSMNACTARQSKS